MNKKIQYFDTKSDSILKSPVNLVKKKYKKWTENLPSDAFLLFRGV